MKAYQRIIREEKEQTNDNLFGKWWESVDTTLSKAVVRETTYETAKRFIEDYEWMRVMPAIVLYCYGIFFDKNCGGCVVYSPEYAENLGVWDKYGYTGKLVLLARGACAHWTPTNTASRLIRQSIRLLPREVEVITATVDPKAGEVGTIYQACGFNYVGTMHQIDPNRFGLEVDGRVLGSRTMRHRHGKQDLETMKKFYPDAKMVKQITKGRYFCFRGENQGKHLEAVRHLLKPYPKRGE